MATVLITWEQGSGLGHLACIEPIATGLKKRGHKVLVAIKDFTNAHRVFSDPDITLLPTPIRLGHVKNSISPATTYAHVLHNIGFSDSEELKTRVRAWVALYALVKPDLIVADFSPTAHLAASGGNAMVTSLGPSFSCPARCDTFSDWAPEAGWTSTQIKYHEQRVLDNVNSVRESIEKPSLSRLSEIFPSGDKTILLTYKELDHFLDRENTIYRGILPEMPGEAPAWPNFAGPKIFAYLRVGYGIEALLSALISLGYPTILRASGDATVLQKKYSAPNLLWESRFIDIDKVAAECTLGIVNATHNMSSALLLAGRPLLMLPPFLEQVVTAKRITELGAGLTLGNHDLPEAIQRLASDSNYREAAESFKERYTPADRNQQLQEALETLDTIASSRI